MFLNLNARGPRYRGLTISISYLLMTWLLSSLRHEQPWYWIYRIGRSCLTWGRIWTTCVISMWRNDTNVYMFFPSAKKYHVKGFYWKNQQDKMSAWNELLLITLICSQNWFIWVSQNVRRLHSYSVLVSRRGKRQPKGMLCVHQHSSCHNVCAWWWLPWSWSQDMRLPS